MSSWVPLSYSPDLWSQGTIPQPKHHPSEEEGRNCVLLWGCSRQCRREGLSAPPPAISCGETSGGSAEPILGCSSVGFANIPTTPAAQNFPRWVMKFRWLSAASWHLKNGISTMLKMSCLPKLQWPKVQTVAGEENFCKSCSGTMHWSFVSLFSLGFANTVSQTAASLVVQGFGGASHATRDFGVSGAGRWGTPARGGLPGFYHSFNSFEGKFSSRKYRCHKNLVLELEKVVAMKTDGLISFPVKLGAVPAMLELLVGLGRPCLSDLPVECCATYSLQWKFKFYRN